MLIVSRNSTFLMVDQLRAIYLPYAFTRPIAIWLILVRPGIDAFLMVHYIKFCFDIPSLASFQLFIRWLAIVMWLKNEVLEMRCIESKIGLFRLWENDITVYAVFHLFKAIVRAFMEPTRISLSLFWFYWP